jgi:hypothetical protein
MRGDVKGKRTVRELRKAARKELEKRSYIVPRIVSNKALYHLSKMIQADHPVFAPKIPSNTFLKGAGYKVSQGRYTFTGGEAYLKTPRSTIGVIKRYLSSYVQRNLGAVFWCQDVYVDADYVLILLYCADPVMYNQVRRRRDPDPEPRAFSKDGKNTVEIIRVLESQIKKSLNQLVNANLDLQRASERIATIEKDAESMFSAYRSHSTDPIAIETLEMLKLLIDQKAAEKPVTSESRYLTSMLKYGETAADDITFEPRPLSEQTISIARVSKLVDNLNRSTSNSKRESDPKTHTLHIFQHGAATSIPEADQKPKMYLKPKILEKVLGMNRLLDVYVSASKEIPRDLISKMISTYWEFDPKKNTLKMIQALKDYESILIPKRLIEPHVPWLTQIAQMKRRLIDVSLSNRRQDQEPAEKQKMDALMEAISSVIRGVTQTYLVDDVMTSIISYHISGKHLELHSVMLLKEITMSLGRLALKALTDIKGTNKNAMAMQNIRDLTYEYTQELLNDPDFLKPLVMRLAAYASIAFEILTYRHTAVGSIANSETSFQNMLDINKLIRELNSINHHEKNIFSALKEHLNIEAAGSGFEVDVNEVVPTEVNSSIESGTTKGNTYKKKETRDQRALKRMRSAENAKEVVDKRQTTAEAMRAAFPGKKIVVEVKSVPENIIEDMRENLQQNVVQTQEIELEDVPILSHQLFEKYWMEPSMSKILNTIYLVIKRDQETTNKIMNGFQFNLLMYIEVRFVEISCSEMLSEVLANRIFSICSLKDIYHVFFSLLVKADELKNALTNENIVMTGLMNLLNEMFELRATFKLMLKRKADNPESVKKQLFSGKLTIDVDVLTGHKNIFDMYKDLTSLSHQISGKTKREINAQLVDITSILDDFLRHLPEHWKLRSMTMEGKQQYLYTDRAMYYKTITSVDLFTLDKSNSENNDWNVYSCYKKHTFSFSERSADYFGA